MIKVNSKAHEVYLDNNATTAVLDSVAEVVQNVMQTSFGNPSSSHIAGVRAKHLVETSREMCRKVLGAHTGEIIFTSGATEGIQTAVVSALLAVKQNSPEKCNAKHFLLYGATEHKAVPNTLIHWNEALGINATVQAIPVDSNGILDLDFIADYAEKSLMVCTMAVNNETGVYQDLDAVEKAIRTHNKDVAWMVDCVQALGKRELNISDTTIDYAPFSGHKLYGPKGIGLLYVGENSAMSPFIAGGGQENGIRSGTENTSGIAAFGKIFSLLLDENDDTFKPVETLYAYREQLANTLKEVFPDIVYNHDFAYSVPTTLNFSVKGLSSKEVMDLFDAASIRVSAGSACSSKTTRSFVLDAMAKPSWQSESAIRMSFGPAATQAEIDHACEAILNIKPALEHACMVLSDAREAEGAPLQTGLIQLKTDDCCTWVYIDEGERSCVIIDPVEAIIERVSRWVHCQELTVKAIIDTHAHYDRSSSQGVMKHDILDFVPQNYRACDANGWPIAVDGHLDCQDQHLPYLSLGEYKLALLPTPGHTNDSKSLLFVNANNDIDIALVGDLMMPAGLGRTDVNSSDAGKFYTSVKLLAKLLGDDTTIGCSHDYHQHFVTTFGQAKVDTPILADVIDGNMSQSDFVDAKAKLDTELKQVSAHYLCGLVNVGEQDQPYSLISDNISGFLNDHKNATVLDLRENYECDVSDLQALLGLEEAVNNVPLNKLAEYVALDKQPKDAPLLLVCRTGNRSLLACKALIRLGYSQVYNIRGGVALYQSLM